MAKTATKTFKCDPWIAAGIHQMAHARDISDGEWVRRVLTDALIKAGVTPETYYTTNDNR
ncbi:hypothetical protein QFZ22_003764 [Streptomyces canus]|uniref:Transposase n=1 Tax=Streptomyces canus TaxID=58343 RepID=A0AAW8FDH7_9ACTN|nr:hypothetical protein [Streptomyces canus]